MRLFRRVTTTVLIPLLIQLMVVGNGTACDAYEHGRPMGAGNDGASHAAMEAAPERSSLTAPDGARLPGPDDGCTTTPLASGNCSMPASCATPVLPTTVAAAFDAGAVSTDRWADPAIARPAPVAAPELPPPRA